MKLTKRLCLLWSVGLLCSAAMLWAGPWGGGSSDYDYYDRPDHSDSSSSSSAPITALALQNTMFGAASRTEAAVWEHLDARAAGRDGGFGAWLAPYYEHSKTDDLGVDGLTLRRNSGGSGFGLDFDFEMTQNTLDTTNYDFAAVIVDYLRTNATTGRAEIVWQRFVALPEE